MILIKLCPMWLDRVQSLNLSHGNASPYHITTNNGARRQVDHPTIGLGGTPQEDISTPDGTRVKLVLGYRKYKENTRRIILECLNLALTKFSLLFLGGEFYRASKTGT